MSKATIKTIPTTIPLNKNIDVTVRVLEVDPELDDPSNENTVRNISASAVNLNIFDDIIDSANGQMDILKYIDCSIIINQGTVRILEAKNIGGNNYSYPSKYSDFLGKPTKGTLDGNVIVMYEDWIDDTYPDDVRYGTDWFPIKMFENGNYASEILVLLNGDKRAIQDILYSASYYEYRIVNSNNPNSEDCIFYGKIFFDLRIREQVMPQNPVVDTSFDVNHYLSSDNYILYRPNTIYSKGASVNRDRTFVMYGDYNHHVNFAYQSIPLMDGNIFAIQNSNETAPSQILSLKDTDWSCGMILNYSPTTRPVEKRPTQVAIQDYYIDIVIKDKNANFKKSDRLYINTTKFDVLDVYGNVVESKFQPFTYLKLFSDRKNNKEIVLNEFIALNNDVTRIIAEPVGSFYFTDLDNGDVMYLSFNALCVLKNTSYQSPPTWFKSEANIRQVVGNMSLSRHWRKITDKHFVFMSGYTKDFCLVFNTDKSKQTEFGVYSTAGQKLIEYQNEFGPVKPLLDISNMTYVSGSLTVYAANVGRKYCQASTQILIR